MKQCSVCGRAYSDFVTICPSCKVALDGEEVEKVIFQTEETPQPESVQEESQPQHVITVETDTEKPEPVQEKLPEPVSISEEPKTVVPENQQHTISSGVSEPPQLPLQWYEVAHRYRMNHMNYAMQWGLFSLSFGILYWLFCVDTGRIDNYFDNFSFADGDWVLFLVGFGIVMTAIQLYRANNPDMSLLKRAQSNRNAYLAMFSKSDAKSISDGSTFWAVTEGLLGMVTTWPITKLIPLIKWGWNRDVVCSLLCLTCFLALCLLRLFRHVGCIEARQEYSKLKQ